MKISFVLSASWIAIITTFLSYSAPVWGDDGSRAMLNQALDLVQQVLHPDGDQPSDDQRADSLTQALQLIQESPGRNFRGHRARAAGDIKAALDEIKKGDPNNTASAWLRKADSELSAALSIAT